MAGTVYSKSGNVSQLTLMTSYAREYIQTTRVSQLFKRNLLAAMLFGRYGMSGELGRPGAYAIMGGRAGSEAQRTRVAAYDRVGRVHSRKSTGFKHMANGDTSPAVDTSQDKNNISYHYRYAHARQAIKVDNDATRFAVGGYKLADATQEAVEEAVNVLIDNVTPFLYLGDPADQAADKWSQPLGLISLMATSGTFANINRSAAPGSTCWIGKRVTTASAATLSLIDDANITQGAQDTGPGIDLVACGAANFLKFKAEAQARMQYQVATSMPKIAQVGAMYEAFQYGKVTICYDPWIQDYSSGTWPSGLTGTDISAYVFMLASQDMNIDIHPQGNFRISNFVDQGEQAPGGEDAKTAFVELMYRPWWEHPNWHVLYTSVS